MFSRSAILGFLACLLASLTASYAETAEMEPYAVRVSEASSYRGLLSFDDKASEISSVKAMFEDSGVGFPPGSFLKLLPGIGHFLFYNTPENNQRAKEVILGGSTAYQIEVTGAFVQFDKKSLAKLDGPVDQATNEDWIALRKNGKGHMVEPFRLVTLHGVNAVVENVREIIYPTEYDVFENDVTIKGYGKSPADSGLYNIPGAFETRETGIILNLTPTLSPDKKTINLTLLPEICELVRWQDLSIDFTDAHGIQQTVPRRQPIFASRNLALAMFAESGETITVSCGWDAKKESMTVIFMSARADAK